MNPKRPTDAEIAELLRTAKSLLFYVETYGGEVTANIEAAFPMYRAAIAAVEQTNDKNEFNETEAF